MTRVDSPVPLMHHDPDRSWITGLDPDHPKGTQPKIHSDIASLVVNNNYQGMIFTFFTLDARYFTRNRFPVTAPPHNDHTVYLLLSPPVGLFFSSTFEGELNREGGFFNLAKHITCSKNTVVSDRVDLRVVQFKSLSKVFDSLVGA